MSDDRSPSKELIADTLSLRKLISTYRLLKSPEWRDFFVVIYGVGLVTSLVSAGIILLLYFILQVVTAGGPLDILGKFVSTAGLSVILIWYLAHYLVRAVDATVEPALPFEKGFERFTGKFQNWGTPILREFFATILRSMTLAFTMVILMVYRNALIVDYPNVSAVTDFGSILIWMLTFALDLGYIGLFLTTTSYGYDFLMQFRITN